MRHSLEPMDHDAHLARPEDWHARLYASRPSGQGESPFGPGGLWGFVKRRAVTILMVFLLVGLTAAAVTYLLPRRFESTASFLVERPRQNGTSEALAMLDRLGQVQSTETEAELLRGRRVVEPVVDRLDLHVRFADGYDAELRPTQVFADFVAGPDARPGTYRLLPDADGYRAEDEKTGQLLGSAAAGGALAFAGITLTVPAGAAPDGAVITVQPFAQAVEQARARLSAAPASRQSDLLQLTCSGPSAESANVLCAEVQTSYLALRAELQRAEASAAADFLDDQVQRVRIQLNEAEDSLQYYQERNSAIALDEQATQGIIQSAMLQARRRELTAERSALSSLITAIAEGSGGVGKYRQLASFPSFLQTNDHIVSRLVESLVELEDRRSELAVRRTDEDPELASVDQRVGEIELQLLSIAEGYQASLAAQIASLGETIVEQGRDLAAVPEQQVESARLERRVSVLEDLYRYLQTRLQEAQVAEAVTLPSVRIVDQPSVPFEAAWPNVPLNLALGLFLGLSTGLMVGLWREYTDVRVRDRHELSDWGIPVLSMIPRIPKGVLPATASSLARTGFVPRNRKASLEEMDVSYEAFRTLAFEVEAAGARVSGHRLGSVAISSAGRGDGKTFCASNLAVQSAMRGQKTLLIDADMRARGVGRWFGISSDRPGLGDMIRSEEDPRTLFASFVRGFEVADGVNLDVLPSGRESPSSPRLITARLRQIIEAAADEYDLVIADTPPLNVMSDAAQVASSVDGVVIVVRAGVTERPALEMALEQLSRVRGEVLGVVLNEVELPEYYASYPERIDAKV